MLKHKKLFFLICGMIFLYAIVANAAEGVNQKESGEIKLEAPVERLGRPLGPADIAYINRKAEEKYEQRNAEITPWVEDGSQPNPGNAALLYYEALLLIPEPNSTVYFMLGGVSEEYKPSKQLKIYMGQCLQAIELVDIASRMQDCIWSAWPKVKRQRDAFPVRVAYLYDILLCDAMILATEGHYRVALERCLTIRRLTHHLSKESTTYYWFVRYLGADVRALDIIQEILCMMPPDEDILTWLRGQLAVVEGTPPLFNECLQELVRSMLRNTRTNPDRVARLRNMLIESANDETTKEEVRNLTDDQLISRTGKGFQHVEDRIFRIVDSEMDVEQKLTEMQRLFNNKTKTDVVGPAVTAIMSLYNVDLKREIDVSYFEQVSHQTWVNSIKAAVEICLVAAKTGRLPEKLPDYLPRDPFTGRDFLYEITDEGFTLRCQSGDRLGRKLPHEGFIFKVK